MQPSGELGVLGLHLEQSPPVRTAALFAELLDHADVITDGMDDRSRPEQVVGIDQDHSQVPEMVNWINIGDACGNGRVPGPSVHWARQRAHCCSGRQAEPTGQETAARY